MTHLPFIAGAYGAFVVVAVGFSAAAWVRLASAKRRLAALDPRARA